MSNYTQILNLSATTPVAGAVTLSLKFTASNSLPGGTVSSAAVLQPATGTTGITGVYADVNGLSVVTTAITQDNMMSADPLMNYTLSATRAALENIGTATSYTVGTTVFAVGAVYADAPAALAAAMDSLLASTIDATGTGGRAAIQLLAVDGRTGGSYSATDNKFAKDTGASFFDNHLATPPVDFGSDNGDFIVASAAETTGLLRTFAFLKGDPAIGHFDFFAWNGVIPGAGTAATTAGGIIPSGFYALNDMTGLPDSANATAVMAPVINIPSMVAVASSASSAPQYVNYPIDAATLNALGAIGNELHIFLNVAPQTALTGQKLVQNFVSINLAQADALINNSNTVYVSTMDPVQTPSSGLSSDPQSFNSGSIAFTDVFKVRDTASNIQAMTVEQASNLTNLMQIIPNPGDPSHFAPSNIEIMPVTATGALDSATPITLDFGVAQVFANNHFMISQQAKVSVNIGGGFGTVTGDDIQNLVRAGVDKLAFDNTYTPAVASVPATATTPAIPAKPASDPFAGLGVRQVIIDQNQLADVGKVGISGLTAVVNGKLTDNKSIDVVVNVDDSFGSVNIPTTLLTKLGVDRIVASDGNLDISLNDARNLTKTGVLLGTAGDNSDVTLHVTNINDLSTFKALTVQKFAASGIDVVAIDVGDQAQGMTPSGAPELAMYQSLSQSKNVLDAISAGKLAGLSVDMSGTEIGFSLSSILAPGAGVSFVNSVNALGHLNVGTVSADMMNPGYAIENILTVASSGIKDNWVEVTDMSRMNYDGQIQTLAMLTKSIAKADAAGVVLLKAGTGDLGMYGEATGLYDTLYSQNTNPSDMIHNMQTFGTLIKGIKNIYADFTVSNDQDMQINSTAANNMGSADLQNTFLNNFAKLGLRGIVVNENVVNDFVSLGENQGIDLTDGNYISQNLPISQMAQTLDIIYKLDADSTTSSTGLSEYVYQSGSIYDNGGAVMKDGIFAFRANVNAIDKIMITNAANGDMSIDLSELGLYGANTNGVTASNFSSVVSHRSTDANDTFHLAASNGHDVIIQIVGLTDYTQFTASDLKEGYTAAV